MDTATIFHSMVKSHNEHEVIYVLTFECVTLTVTLTVTLPGAPTISLTVTLNVLITVTLTVS